MSHEWNDPIMTLPRWLVICLLGSSVLAPLAAAGWRWVTWPERTSTRLLELLRNGNVVEANQFTNGGEWILGQRGAVALRITDERGSLDLTLRLEGFPIVESLPQFRVRNCADIFYCRQAMTVAPVSAPNGTPDVCLVVRKNRVSVENKARPSWIAY